jgi:hypothetical protein
MGQIYEKGSSMSTSKIPLITDSNQAYIAKMTGRRVQEVLCALV